MASTVAPTSRMSENGSSLSPRRARVGYTAASAARRTPGSSWKWRTHESIPAPVLPADTSASASPSATSRAATDTDASFLRASASPGFSSMETNSEACCTEMRSPLWRDLGERLVDERAVTHQQRVDVRGLQRELRGAPDDLRGAVIAPHHVEGNGDGFDGHGGPSLQLRDERRRAGSTFWIQPSDGNRPCCAGNPV